MSGLLPRGILLTIATASGLLLVGSLILTLLSPPHRIWPPPGRRSWQYWYTWGLTGILFGGIILLGLVDWNSFVLDSWIRFIPAGVCIALGWAFALWAVQALGVHASSGLRGELLTTGPYRYSRNPQYAGDILAAVGFAILFNSVLALLPIALGIAWFVLAPFTEEPWLRKQFGTRYDAYRATTPRFLLSFKCSQACTINDGEENR